MASLPDFHAYVKVLWESYNGTALPDYAFVFDPGTPNLIVRFVVVNDSDKRGVGNVVYSLRHNGVVIYPLPSPNTPTVPNSFILDPNTVWKREFGVTAPGDYVASIHSSTRPIIAGPGEEDVTNNQGIMHFTIHPIVE
jgi:hypothetical protein